MMALFVPVTLAGFFGAANTREQCDLEFLLGLVVAGYLLLLFSLAGCGVQFVPL